MSSYMSVMINEALSSNITKILSLKYLKICPFLIKCIPFSQMNLFSNIIAAYTGQEYNQCFFEKFDPQYATGMTFKWLTLAKAYQIPAKMKEYFKNMKKE